MSRRSALASVIQWTSFTIVLFGIGTALWIDVNLDCVTNDGDYSGCPHHLAGPLRILFPYGFVLTVVLGVLALRARIATAPLTAGSFAVVLIVLGGLQWWLTGDILLRGF